MAYQTEQREILHCFFEEHPHRPLTAKEIAEALSDASISLSAIYRNLAAMTEEGVLRCTVKAGSREKLYQFVDSQTCRACIHLHCLQCGQMFHMSHRTAAVMQRRLAENDEFQVDCTKTVVYGLCKACRKASDTHPHPKERIPHGRSCD